MSRYYAQLNREKRVIGLSDLAGEVESEWLVPIDEQQFNNLNLLNTKYVDGAFAGSIAELSGDKATIESDGEDLMTLSLSVFDWEGRIQQSFNDQVLIDVNGIQQPVQVTKGKMEMTLSSEEPGEFWVRTVGLDRNAVLKVVVSDGN
ncbi:hypothetical protein DFP94_11290 [Fontibacillus phaseoli]|uniref:Uncharacterized protein n=1 Tax=Fontibacillus phaseoli TaxID=1416533 RepID=A0A369B4I9_9BACL|nr:hypothetical protein [Fontibacillus phaseoli]RCX16470.1 hypothetical protein DFP94_11290 [Fontibacillus phaseoli]